MKLGYSEGQGLGTQKQGRSEPLPLPLKRRREGLGTVQRKRPMLPRRDATGKTTPLNRSLSPLHCSEAEMAKTTEFREEMSLRMTWKKTEKRLRAARHLIEDLDMRVGIERNPFWLPDPEVRLPVAPVCASKSRRCVQLAAHHEETETDRLQSMRVSDAFAASVAYLRGQHAYCFWCRLQVLH